MKRELVLLCEHSSCNVPEELKDLGLPKSVLASHIGYDIGALDLAEYISSHFNAKLFKASVSRLVIDCNRDLEDLDIIPKSRCDVAIPNNVNIKDTDKEQRFILYKQYHKEINEYIKTLSKQEVEPVIVSIHSFSSEYFSSIKTPTYVDCGVLFNKDGRLSDYIMKAFKGSNFNVQKNQPYDLKDYKSGGVIEHGEKNNYPYAGLEFPYSLLMQKKWRETIGNKIIQGIEGFISSV